MLRKVSFTVWFSVIVLTAFAVGYLSWAKATFNWPYDDTFYPYPEKRASSPLQGEGGGEVASWKTYRNEEYGFEVKYPEEYESLIGEIAQNSALGTVENEVPGVFIGFWVFVKLDSIDLKKKAEIWLTLDERSNSDTEFPIYCDEPPNINNPTIEIKIISCRGDGGPAIYGSLKSRDQNIFVDGVSGGYDFARSNNPNFYPAGKKPLETLAQILSTFKFIESKQN